MADVTVERIQADSIQTTDLSTGSLIVSGKARFVQPIYTSGIENAQDINQVTTGNISDTSYVLFSNGTNLYRVLYSDLINDLSTKVTIDIPDSEGVGY